MLSSTPSRFSTQVAEAIALVITVYSLFLPHLSLQYLQNLAGRLATSTIDRLPSNIKEFTLTLFLPWQLQAVDIDRHPTPTTSTIYYSPTGPSNIECGIIGCCAFLAAGTSTIIIMQYSRPSRPTPVAPSSRQLWSATRAEKSASFNDRKGNNNNENDEERSNSGRSNSNKPDPDSEAYNPFARNERPRDTSLRLAQRFEDHLVIQNFKTFIEIMLMSNQSIIIAAVSNAATSTSLPLFLLLVFSGFIVSHFFSVLSPAVRPRLEGSIARRMSDNDSQLQNTVNIKPDSLKDKALSIFTFDELLYLSKEIVASQGTEIKSDSQKKTAISNFNPSTTEFIPIQHEPLVGGNSSLSNPIPVVDLTDTSVDSAPHRRRRNHRNRGRGRLAALQAAQNNQSPELEWL